jgi:hypothetical protein
MTAKCCQQRCEYWNHFGLTKGNTEVFIRNHILHYDCSNDFAPPNRKARKE